MTHEADVIGDRAHFAQLDNVGATADAHPEGSTSQEGSGEEDHQKVTEVIGGNAVATAAPADDLNNRVTIDSVRNHCARQFPVQQLVSVPDGGQGLPTAPLDPRSRRRGEQDARRQPAPGSWRQPARSRSELVR